MPTTIYVCDTCRHSREDKIGPDGKTGGEILAEQLETLAEGVPDIIVQRQSMILH